MTKTISIDIDGVLSDFISSFKNLTNKLWPYRLAEDYFPSDWDFADNLSKEEWKIGWKKLEETKNFWLSEPPICNNVLALSNFVKENSPYKIYYITARKEIAGMNVLEQTNRWLDRFDLLGGGTSAIVVPSAKDKASLIETLKIDYSIDDYGPTIEQCYSIPNHYAYLLRYPYNDKYSYLRSVNTLKQFLDIVEHPAGYPSLIDHTPHGYKE